MFVSSESHEQRQDYSIFILSVLSRFAHHRQLTMSSIHSNLKALCHSQLLLACHDANESNCGKDKPHFTLIFYPIKEVHHAPAKIYLRNIQTASGGWRGTLCQGVVHAHLKGTQPVGNPYWSRHTRQKLLHISPQPSTPNVSLLEEF